MAQPKCHRKALSLGRGVLCDYVHYCESGHSATAERLMRVPAVVAARLAALPRPSWAAIMTRAFALAARNHPEMRSAYFSFPWGHIGEYEWPIANVIMVRRVGDEDVLFLAPLHQPESQSLQALDAHLRRYQEAPLESIHAFRQAMRINRLPRLIRRFLWWLSLNVFPNHRVRDFGTFGVTTMSPYGAKTLQVPSLWAALLHYGPISDAGEVSVGLVFDHRIMDGGVVGYTLMEMEQVLQHEIVAELQSMRGAQAA